MIPSDRPPPRSSSDPDAPVVGLEDLEEARALYAQLDPAWFDEANDPERWLFEPEVQKLIAEIVQADVAVFAHLLSPEDLQVLREELTLACHTDPVSIEYLRRIRPRTVPDASGKMRKGMFDAPNVLPLPGKKAGGERP